LFSLTVLSAAVGPSEAFSNAAYFRIIACWRMLTEVDGVAGIGQRRTPSPFGFLAEVRIATRRWRRPSRPGPGNRLRNEP